MNREIKFRGKRINNGEWVQGSLHVGDRCWIAVKSKDENLDLQPFRPYEVITETVGQYTGLKDKNGIEICDGDIVAWDDDLFNLTRKELVTWSKYGAFIIGSQCNNLLHHIVSNKPNVKVIGNIHDDPELLKSK